MAVNQHRAGKGISKFISRFLWHLEQQPIPNYSQVNRKRSQSASRKVITKQGVTGLNGSTLTSGIHAVGTLNLPKQRRMSLRERAGTLDAITEE